MNSRFARYATAFLVYMLAVILFGAWVRITHSGAGCGSHWPTCHGQVIPFEPSTETIIEYTHRVTSGLLGVLGLGLVGWAWARHRGGRVFLASVVTLILIVFEALIGAGLVLRELVADDASVARAVVIALHLANTLILTASATMTIWWDRHDDPFDARANRGLIVLSGIGLVAIVLTSMTGAVTALGDTLFPVDPTGSPLLQRLGTDLAAANHFLVRLRVVHPVIAVLTAVFLAALAYIVRARDLGPMPDRWASLLLFTVVAQIAIGIANVALAAPGWLQLLHLLVAQLVWSAALLLTVALGSERV